MTRAHVAIITALILLGCDESPSDSGAKAKTAATPAEDAKTSPSEAQPGEADAKTETKSSARSRARKPKGSASVDLDGTTWTAQRMTARVRDDKLKLSASITDREGSKMTRQQLTLTLHGYQGVGSYTTKMLDSSFSGVGIDTDEIKAAEGDDAKTNAATLGALRGGKVTLLPNAKVEITAVSDEFIDGTFTWSPNGGMQGPTMTDGTFHAAVRK
ncbi:MAG: hypothetical protein K0V04_22995 [Deltaproteobacteria bacterium]|nr:hypothetical protein [Deltaproteobacteria bacterium]